MEQVKIRHLNLEKLVDYNIIALNYYRLHYNFNSIMDDGKYKNIPIRKASLMIIYEANRKEGLEYPWDDYIQGFISQYEIGLPKPYIEDHDAKMGIILDAIKPNPGLPIISFKQINKKERLKYFDQENAFNHGVETALSILAWEIIIRDLSTYEYLFRTDEKNYSSLFNSLTNGGYIKDVSLSVFNDVMNYQRLANGKNKIMWTGKKSEAVYFQKEINLTMKKFNECFVSEDGKKFAEKNRLATNPEKKFFDIIEKHKHR